MKGREREEEGKERENREGKKRSAVQGALPACPCCACFLLNYIFFSPWHRIPSPSLHWQSFRIYKMLRFQTFITSSFSILNGFNLSVKEKKRKKKGGKIEKKNGKNFFFVFFFLWLTVVCLFICWRLFVIICWLVYAWNYLPLNGNPKNFCKKILKNVYERLMLKMKMEKGRSRED